MAATTVINISAAQIRAARGILNWSQEELADASELSIATIRKLEAGSLSPREQTGRALRQTFQKAGIDFIEPDGVRRKTEEIIIYEGDEGIRAFFDSVYLSSIAGGEIVQVWPSRKQFEIIIGDYIETHVNRMMKARDLLNLRCIYTEVPEAPPRPYCQHRFLSKHFVASVPFFVYEDKYAIVSLNESRPKIILIQSPVAAASFRQQFESMWEKAVPLEYKPKN